MPYIVVKCHVDEVDVGTTYYGDKTTEAAVVQALGRSWYSNRGFYVVQEPVCWVLNKLEEYGYIAPPTPVLQGHHLLWMTYRPLNWTPTTIASKKNHKA